MHANRFRRHGDLRIVKVCTGTPAQETTRHWFGVTDYYRYIDRSIYVCALFSGSEVGRLRTKEICSRDPECCRADTAYPSLLFGSM